LGVRKEPAEEAANTSRDKLIKWPKLFLLNPFYLCQHLFRVKICSELCSITRNFSEYCRNHSFEETISQSFFGTYLVDAIERAFIICFSATFLLNLEAAFYKFDRAENYRVGEASKHATVHTLLKRKFFFTFDSNHSFTKLITCENNRVYQWNSHKWRSNTFIEAFDSLILECLSHHMSQGLLAAFIALHSYFHAVEGMTC